MTLPVVDVDTLVELGGAGGDDPVVATVDSPYAASARAAALPVPEPEVPQQWATEPGPAGSGVLVVAVVPLEDVTQTGRTLSLLLTGVVPVLVLRLRLAVWVVLGRALRPVEDLRAAAAAVAASGGPGSLPVPRTGELAALAQTLNTMLDRLTPRRPPSGRRRRRRAPPPTGSAPSSPMPRTSCAHRWRRWSRRSRWRSGTRTPTRPASCSRISMPTSPG